MEGIKGVLFSIERLVWLRGLGSVEGGGVSSESWDSDFETLLEDFEVEIGRFEVETEGFEVETDLGLDLDVDTVLISRIFYLNMWTILYIAKHTRMLGGNMLEHAIFLSKLPSTMSTLETKQLR